MPYIGPTNKKIYTAYSTNKKIYTAYSTKSIKGNEFLPQTQVYKILYLSKLLIDIVDHL